MSNLPRLSECRDCHEPIRFVRMSSGKLMPINPAQRDDVGHGTVAARFEGQTLGGLVLADGQAIPAGYPFLFTPHWSTCEAHRNPAPPPTPADEPLF